ncbi:MAG: sugar phosphate nucleotidyltransferase, partial [Anaerovoracaceae bacterium]
YPAKISFIEEDVFLGTSGGLKLIEKEMKETFFFTNCDVLVDVDYSEVIRHHKEQKALLTMITSAKNLVIPYGTVEVDESGCINKINEKPANYFMINTGVYVIEPKFFDYIPDNEFSNMTDIIENCIEAGENISVFPVSEDAWMDMGQIDELEKMRRRFE